MPTFSDATMSDAPPEQVWKLLYDPARFPDWWAGVETVEAGGGDAGGTGEEYTMYPEGYPDFPMGQLLRTERDERRVTVSCLVSDLCFQWRLEPVAQGTHITVEVEIPEAEGHRLEAQRETIRASLRRLAELAGD